MPKIKILVATQQNEILCDNNEIYLPIHVGKALSNIELGIIGDNTGENISTKNPYYCELTAIYWGWKNLKDVDYIGLCHYRRYFNFNSHPFLMIEEENVTYEDFLNNIKYTKLDENIFDYDVVLPTSRPFSDNVMKEHIMNLDFIDMAVLEKIILRLYPDYRESIKYVFYKKQDVPQRNMFIMKKDIFDEYCNFLFSILFEVEKYVKLSPYTHYKRIFGFMGELLLPLFCFHNKLRIKRKRILFITKDIQKPKKNKFSIIISNTLCKIRFILNTMSLKTILFSDFFDPLIKKEIPELYNN